MEYDNPPQKIPVQFEMGEKTVGKSLPWFSYESDKTRNSNAYDLAAELVHSCFARTNGFTVMNDLAKQLAKQIESKHDLLWIVEHKLNHLMGCIGNASFDELFDDRFDGLPRPIAQKVEKLSDDVRSVIDTMTILYGEIRNRHLEQLEKRTSGVGEEGRDNPDVILRQLWEEDRQLTEIEDDIFRSLEDVLKALNHEQRLRLFCAEPSLFKQEGVFFTYADRRFRADREHHFNLPLLGKMDFAFSNFENALVICIKNAGHFFVHEDIEPILDQFGSVPLIRRCSAVQYW